MARDLQPRTLVKPGRRRLWNILLAFVIFFSGIIAGGGLTAKFMTNTFQKSFRQSPELADQIAHRMQRRLDLTDEQAMRVRRILRENLAAFRALRREYRPLVVAQIEKTRQELETVLTQEQNLKMQRRFNYLFNFWLRPVPDEKPGEQPR